MLKKQISFLIFFNILLLVGLIKNERQADEIGLVFFSLICLIFAYLTRKD